LNGSFENAKSDYIKKILPNAWNIDLDDFA
jgi:hypothetical protein